MIEALYVYGYNAYNPAKPLASAEEKLHQPSRVHGLADIATLRAAQGVIVERLTVPVRLI